MRRSLVVLDQGHLGATGGRRGASFGTLTEEQCVSGYGAAAQAALLRSEGIDPAFSGVGSYRLRQTAARRAGARAYLALHTNAGAAAMPKHRGVIFHHYAATDRGGLGLARALANRLSVAFGWDVITYPATSENWTKNAFALISHLGPVPGVVIEPGYIDHPDHQYMWTPAGLVELGEAIAAGVTDFL